MRLPKFLFAIALCLILPVVVFAHPGRTDSSGGHYDRSTGEYHYHHGYPAHDHSDMDGDGVLDCPYEFKDKTKLPSNNTDSPNSPTTETKKTESTFDVSEEPPKAETHRQEKEKSIDDYLTIGGLGLLILACVVDGVIFLVDKAKKRFKK